MQITQKMDREISSDYIKQRRRKVIIRISIAVVVFAALFIMLPSWIAPVANLSEYEIAKTDVGVIEVSFSANGTVVPTYNEVITSPISTTVLRINFLPGDNITTFDTIIVPDISQEKRLLDNFYQELIIKQNAVLRSNQQIVQNKRQLRLSLYADSIQVEQLASSLRKEKQLLNIGGGSQEKVDLAEMNYKVSQINREKQLQEYSSFVLLSLIDVKTQQIEQSILEDKISQQKELINRAFIRSKTSGVITKLDVQPGQRISAGHQVATIADVTNFKIIGNVPGKYANRINYNQQVRVNVQDSVLLGVITGISPEVESGSVNFTVTLADSDNALLRAQLKTDVRIIESVNNSAVRLAFGDYYSDNSYIDMFVFNGDKLERRKVLLGGCSFDYVEIKEGLKPGERVVISKSLVETYRNHQTIGFKNDR